MAERPDLFELTTLAHRRDRAMRVGFAGFLYREVAGLVAARLAEVKRDFDRVLLIGTGAGAMRDALPPGAAVTAFDPSLAMAAAMGAGVLESETVPVSEGVHDLAVSALLLHHLNDPVGHLIQLRRALKPDGLMLAALFGGQTLSELRTSLAEAEAEIEGGLSPRVTPMGEIRDLGALLQRADFAMPVADAERLEVIYPEPIALMRDLRAMGETNVLATRRRVPMRRAVLTRACEIYAEHFPAPHGRVRATFEIIFLTGWSPGPDQPQPLAPGSATQRLADALGTREISAGEKAGDGG